MGRKQQISDEFLKMFRLATKFRTIPAIGTYDSYVSTKLAIL